MLGLGPRCTCLSPVFLLHLARTSPDALQCGRWQGHGRWPQRGWWVCRHAAEAETNPYVVAKGLWGSPPPPQFPSDNKCANVCTTPRPSSVSAVHCLAHP